MITEFWICHNKRHFHIWLDEEFQPPYGIFIFFTGFDFLLLCNLKIKKIPLNWSYFQKQMARSFKHRTLVRLLLRASEQETEPVLRPRVSGTEICKSCFLPTSKKQNGTKEPVSSRLHISTLFSTKLVRLCGKYLLAQSLVLTTRILFDQQSKGSYFSLVSPYVGIVWLHGYRH